MKAKKLQIILLLAVFTFFNCSNNDDPQDELPPITQTGANAFGCIINGEVLIPKDGIGVPQPKGLAAYQRPNGNFIINATNLKDVNGDHIYIYII